MIFFLLLLLLLDLENKWRRNKLTSGKRVEQAYFKVSCYQYEKQFPQQKVLHHIYIYLWVVTEGIWLPCGGWRFKKNVFMGRMATLWLSCDVILVKDVVSIPQKQAHFSLKFPENIKAINTEINAFDNKGIRFWFKCYADFRKF